MPLTARDTLGALLIHEATFVTEAMGGPRIGYLDRDYRRHPCPSDAAYRADSELMLRTSKFYRGTGQMGIRRVGCRSPNDASTVEEIGEYVLQPFRNTMFIFRISLRRHIKSMELSL